MRNRLLSGIVLAVLALLGAGTVAPAQAATSSCAGVWVVVDYGSLGGTETACASSYSTGAAALRSAGFSPTINDGFVEEIKGKPSSPDTSKAYWSYWQATLKDDGTYSAWSYSNLGATASHPKQGNAEGWRYQSLNDGKVPPAAAPPKGEASSPTPTPTKTTTKPTATATATKKPTATATATKTATASASATATATATSASPTASASASATTASPTLVATPLSTEQATEAAQEQVSATPYAAPDAGGGTPVGAIVAGAVVVVAGAGLGSWWLWKGRKP